MSSESSESDILTFVEHISMVGFGYLTLVNDDK